MYYRCVSLLQVRLQTSLFLLFNELLLKKFSHAACSIQSMKSALTKFGFFWVTLLFFALSIVGHWYFAWNAFEAEQLSHREVPQVAEFINEVSRDTLENWQSEFLQLIWQVVGLSFLLYVGSSQSKEGDERKEEKLDYILKKLDPKNAKKVLKEFDKKYPRK
jgi:NTP pyrophosphatase (non-canonical NTP hydrolase)